MKGRIMSDDIQNITNKTENTLGQHIQQQEGDTTLSAIGWIRQKLRDFSTVNIKPEILETENLLACRFLLIIGFVASAMIVGIEKLIYQMPLDRCKKYLDEDQSSMSSWEVPLPASI